MVSLVLTVLRSLAAALHTRRHRVLENLALRHQLMVLNRTAKTPALRHSDRVFWAVLSTTWSRWTKALVIVQPRTVVRWHQAGFRLYWRWKSRRRTGRASTDHELIELIRRMWQANPTWVSPRIRDELAKLGLHISDFTVRKYRPRRPHSSSQTWKTFLHNHTQQIVAIDFFTVPTATFRVPCVFIVLAHERRKVVHFAITEAPSACWTGQQLVNAFPFETAPRFLLRDRDGIYGAEFVRRVAGLGMEEKVIAPRSLLQNPYVERLIGSLRRECLDHVIILSERHLHWVIREFLDYYHHHRTHRALNRDCPVPRPVEEADQGEIIELPSSVDCIIATRDRLPDLTRSSGTFP